MMMKLKVLIPSLILSVNLPLLSLVSCNQNIERVDFSHCSWHDIIDACNKLESREWNIEQFFSRFRVDGDLKRPGVQSKDVESFDDFVGQTRKINVNGLEHEIIVLGCQQDYLDQGKQQPVAMTFQFNNVVSDKNGESLLAYWDDTVPFDPEYTPDFWNSTIQKCLNSTNEAYWYDEGYPSTDKRSVFQMMQEDNDELTNNIKNVYRCVNVYNPQIEEAPHYESITQQTKIFLPSLANLFSKIGLKNTSQDIIPWQESPHNLELYYAEGEQYSYYVTGIGDNIIGSETTQRNSFDCLLRYPIVPDTFPIAYRRYWLSSPQMEHDNAAWTALMHDSDDDIHKGAMLSYFISYPAEVAPCFCL